jgi:hypothetical protein
MVPVGIKLPLMGSKLAGVGGLSVVVGIKVLYRFKELRTNIRLYRTNRYKRMFVRRSWKRCKTLMRTTALSPTLPANVEKATRIVLGSIMNVLQKLVVAICRANGASICPADYHDKFPQHTYNAT